MSDNLTNDTRQEANTALMEVEKGLRSSRVGEQCEAIVKFPSLVDRFPFSTLINAAFLKLAEVFRTGINFLRLNILKVLQVTEKHLSKITSVDEFLRRIYAVIHSNDPIARAVTLRMFGSIASIVSERKNVHHSIHHGLDSNDQVEADAAIFATSCLCKHSATFAAGIYEKIAGKIQGLTTPVDKKLSLIPILELMCHDIGTAAQVRELCVKLLPSHPTLSFVTAFLHTLTSLSLKTLVHVSDQVKLLLCYAQGDGRKAIRCRALLELKTIASKVPHIWTKEMIQELFVVTERAVRDQERSIGVLTLFILSSSVAVHNMAFLKDKLLVFCYSSPLCIAVRALGVVTNITIAMHRDGVCESGELVEVGRMVTDMCLLTDFNKWEESYNQQMPPFKVMLSSLTQLTAVSKEVGEVTLESLLSLLPVLSDTLALSVCQALVSIVTHTPKAWSYVSPKLMGYLDTTLNRHNILLPVSAILLQLHASDHTPQAREQLHLSILPQLLEHLWLFEHPTRLWIAYKIARRASMMGTHELANPIYTRLSQAVTSVKYRNWLTALRQFSQAQCLVSSVSRQTSGASHLILTLCDSSTSIYDAMNLIKASSPSPFPLKFLSVHASWLNTHCQLLSTCIGLSTIPPPSSDFSNSTEKKFHVSVTQFQVMSQQYSDLYSSLFDADPSTLEYITLLQQSCLLMASVICSIMCSRKPLVSPGRPLTPSSVVPFTSPVELSDNFNTKFLLGQMCRNVFHKVQAAAESLQSLPLSEEHSSILMECSRMILSVPMRLPYYFFVSLQKTTVKLALSPPLPPPGQQVTLTLDTHLTLKVEGVIEHSGKAKMYRSPSAVYVQVNPKLEKLLSHDVKAPELKLLEQTEPVMKDYFQTQFVLTLPVAGYYAVYIEACLLDNKGTVWHIGHKATLNVLVNSEENFKQQQKQREVAGYGSRNTSGGEGKQGQRA